MKAIVIVLVIALILAFAAFVVYNAQQKVDINKAPFAKGIYKNVALAEVVFWAFVAGVVLSLLVFIMIYIKQSVQLHSSNKRIKTLESEVTVLRNRPIEESVELMKSKGTAQTDFKSPFDEGSKQ